MGLFIGNERNQFTNNFVYTWWEDIDDVTYQLSSNLNNWHHWICSFCNSSIDYQKFISNIFKYDCLSFFRLIDLTLFVLCVRLQGNPMFVTTVTVGNFRASCYPQPNLSAAVDSASYQLIQGIQKQGTYQIPSAAPSNQPQNSATETSSGMRHSCYNFALCAYFWFTQGGISHTFSQYLHA